MTKQSISWKQDGIDSGWFFAKDVGLFKIKTAALAEAERLAAHQPTKLQHLTPPGVVQRQCLPPKRPGDLFSAKFSDGTVTMTHECQTAVIKDGRPTVPGR